MCLRDGTNMRSSVIENILSVLEQEGEPSLYLFHVEDWETGLMLLMTIVGKFFELVKINNQSTMLCLNLFIM